MSDKGRKTNTWGWGYEGKYEPPKDHGHNERLHQEAEERKRKRLIEASTGDNEYNRRMHEEAEKRKAERKLDGQARAYAHNQQLHDEAEERRKQREVERVADNTGFEWGGSKYTFSGKIKKIKR